ncbi:protein KTI13 [Monosporozyma servazzii]
MGFEVYSFGSNGNFQLGFPHCEDLMVPQVTLSSDTPGLNSELNISISDHIEKVVCGGNHTVLLLTSGKILLAGNNEMGQLSGEVNCKAISTWGVPDKTWSFEVEDEKIVDVTCGWEFTLVLTSKNKVYVRGNGPKGELGCGSEIKQSHHFLEVIRLQDPGDKVQIFSSFQNCAVLVTNPDKGSKVYAWGSNTKCQLWTPKCRMVTKPSIIFEREDVILDYISMGKDFMVFVDMKGSIIHTIGNIPKTFIWEHWSKKRDLLVLTMWSSIHIVERSPKFQISSYGFNMHKQIFDNETVSELDVDRVTVGSEHGILTTKDGESVSIKCWGWGEHGNCGSIHEDKSKIINDRSNEISVLNEVLTVKGSSKIDVAIYGGCANTWIVIDTKV